MNSDTPLQCVYCDLDGTLLGRGGSLIHTYDGEPSIIAAKAAVVCEQSGIELVIYSGRNKRAVSELARLLGHKAFIYEAGCGLVIDDQSELLTDDFVELPQQSIHDQITATGAPKALLDRYSDRLEYHEPWHVNREISHLFRGLVDVDEVDRFLGESGFNQLRLVDNGTVHRSSDRLQIEANPRAYHLVPSGASKARAVQHHMELRNYQRDRCIAIGDSREDLGATQAVGTFWFVANAFTNDPTIKLARQRFDNVRTSNFQAGEGVYEIIETELRERSGD